MLFLQSQGLTSDEIKFYRLCYSESAVYAGLLKIVQRSIQYNLEYTYIHYTYIYYIYIFHISLETQ